MYLIKIDSWLIDKVFQPTSNRFKKQTRENNFYLSYAFCWLSLGFDVLGDIITVNFHMGMPICFVIFIMIFIGVYGTKMNYLHKSAKNPGIINPERTKPSEITLRLFLLMSSLFLGILFPITTIGLDNGPVFYGLAIISITACMYFSACTPLPD